VQKRLTEITVAPATVKLAPKVDASIATMPKTAAGLTPGIYKYQAKISVAGQEIPIKLSTMIKEEGAMYIATDTMETPMGQVSDEASLDKATLEVKKRSVRQGPMAIDVAYADGKASGKMAMNGQDRPIDGPQVGPCLPILRPHSSRLEHCLWLMATRWSRALPTVGQKRPPSGSTRQAASR